MRPVTGQPAGRALRAPSATVLVIGVEDPQTQAHSINESLHLGVLERAATAEALLLGNLGLNGQVAP